MPIYCTRGQWEHLDEIAVEELQRALDTVEGKKTTERLLAAIADRNGVTQTELAEWYGVQRRTIYNWLVRLDTDGPLEAAVTDDKRTGRNRKLSETQQAAFEDTVHEPPEAVRIDAPAWTPTLVQQHLKDTYDVEYSLPNCRRLLKEAGLSDERARPTPADADEANQEVFRGDHTEGGGWTPQ